MRRRLLPVLLVAAGLAACGGDDGGPPNPQATRDCKSRVEGPRLLPVKRDDDLVAGSIVFHGLRDAGRSALRNPVEAFRSEHGEYAGVKVVAEVRASSVVTVAVAQPDRKRAALLYGLPFPGGVRELGYRLDEGQAVVRFEGCAGDQRRFSGRGVVGPRTQFNGGFILTEPQCLRLDVYASGGKRRYVVPYGRPAGACRD